MKLMKSAKYLVASMVAISALVSHASADTESFTYTQPQTDLGSTALNANFTLTAFDPSLGTLTGVSLTFLLDGTASPQILNLAGGAASYSNVKTSFNTAVTAPDGAILSLNTSSLLLSGSLNTPQFTVTTLASSPVSSGVLLNINSGHLASYEGTTPLTFSIVAPVSPGFTSQGTQTAGTLGFGGTGSVSGTVTVEYIYTAAVPEPSTWVLMLAGLGVLVWGVRSRRA